MRPILVLNDLCGLIWKRRVACPVTPVASRGRRIVRYRRDFPARNTLAQRPIERRTVHVQEVGHVLAGFAFVNQVPGVVDLLRRCAAFTPARVRSEIRDRSSSASTPIICHMARPVGVAVSIASVSEWNFTPRARRSSSIVIRSRRLRPSRSSFQTISVSPCSSFFRQRRRAGRFVVAPESPSPLKTVWHPAFFSAASCKASSGRRSRRGRSRISSPI